MTEQVIAAVGAAVIEYVRELVAWDDELDRRLDQRDRFSGGREPG
jgi:hypothetical protein